ncbi:MAG TPA: hypothetical protein VGC42_20330 [Kofleriaceae bacterium]
MGTTRSFLIGSAIALAGATACNYSLHSSFGGSTTSSSSGTPAGTSAGTPDGSSSTNSSGSSGDSASVAAGEAPRAEPAKPPPDPGFEKLAPPAMPAGPAPRITIVSPAADEELVGARTKAPDDKFESLDCLQDARTFSIKLAAQNWTVSPGGPGVLVVVDGVYATVTHDLAKPIMMTELEPYERVDNNATFADEGPMYTCGHHWIAAVPTAANGQMLPVEPTVSWFFNRSKDYSTRDEKPEYRAVRLERSLPVINWPLIGPIYIGTNWRYSYYSDEKAATRSGRIARDPKRIVFDWTLARGTPAGSCSVSIARQGMQSWEDQIEIPTRGTVVLPAKYATAPLIFESAKCGGMSEYVSMIWTKRPPTLKSYKWPAPGSAQAEDFWHSAEGHEAFNNSGAGHSSGGGGGGGGGGGKCKSQCRLEAGQCRTSCKGAKCANDCNHAEQSCKAGC